MRVVYDLREVLFQGRGWERYGVGLVGAMIQRPEIQPAYIVVTENEARAHHPQLFPRPIETLERPIDPAPRRGFPSCEFVERADLLHSLTDYPDFLPTRPRLVSSVHDLSYHLLPDLRDTEFVGRMRENLAVVLAQADALVCFSNTVSSQIAEFAATHDLVLPPLSCVPHGIDPQFHYARARASDTEVGGVEAPYVIAVGATDRDKNLRLVIDAFANDPWLRSEALLVVVERGGSHDDMRQLHDRDRHRFIRWVEDPSDAQLAALYSRAACAVSASLDEGFGFTPLEAIACGVPAVCSDIPCHREVLDDFARYFPPHDSEACARALKEAFAEPPSPRDASDRADRVTRQYDWYASAEATARVYVEAMAQPDRRRTPSLGTTSRPERYRSLEELFHDCLKGEPDGAARDLLVDWGLAPAGVNLLMKQADPGRAMDFTDFERHLHSVAAASPDYPFDVPSAERQAAAVRAESRLADLVRGRRVVVVGPARGIAGSGLGERIDSYDIVVRLNFGWPCAAALESDLGRRMDILYHCCNGDQPLSRVLTPGFDATRLVCLERRGQSLEMQRECEERGIPTLDVSHVYAGLLNRLGTFPNSGTVAIQHLLGFAIEELHVTGISFFQDPYYESYPGDGASQGSWDNGPPERIWLHDFAVQLDHFALLCERDERVSVDARLEQILADRHG